MSATPPKLGLVPLTIVGVWSTAMYCSIAALRFLGALRWILPCSWILTPLMLLSRSRTMERCMRSSLRLLPLSFASRRSTRYWSPMPGRERMIERGMSSSR